MCKLLVAILCATLLTKSAVASDFQFKGYYKSLAAMSETPQPLNQDYWFDLNRLRLELRDHPADWFAYEVEYDNEALVGSYLRTPWFQQLKTSRAPTYWQLEDAWIDRDSLYVRHRLYRGTVRLRHDASTVLMGRQRVAWGTGRIWNPTDLLNPYNPAQLEGPERPGVDALLLDQQFSAVSGISGVYAPQRQVRDDWAVRLRSHYFQTDVAFMGGNLRGSSVTGADFASRLGDAGTYGEATYTSTHDGRHYVRAVLGGEYAFANTLTVSIEGFSNGAGAPSTAGYDFSQLAMGAIQNVGRRYIGSRVRYEITPLLRIDGVAISNIGDGSVFAMPSLSYSLTEDVELGIGLQLFTGATTSEYGHFHNLGFAQVQWFFGGT